jgi:hypothetical protein
VIYGGIGAIVGGIIGGVTGAARKVESDHLNQESKTLEKQHKEYLAKAKEKAIKEGFVTESDINEYEKLVYPKRYYENSHEFESGGNGANKFNDDGGILVSPKGYAYYNTTYNLDRTLYIPKIVSHPAWDTYRLMYSLTFTYKPFRLALPEMIYCLSSINYSLFFEN